MGVKKDDSDWEDIDQHERDVFDKDGYYDVMNDQDDIAESDLQLLEKFQGQKKVGFSDKLDEKAAGGVNLADLIMQKMATGDYEDGNAELIKHTDKSLLHFCVQGGDPLVEFVKLTRFGHLFHLVVGPKEELSLTQCQVQVKVTGRVQVIV